MMKATRRAITLRIATVGLCVVAGLILAAVTGLGPGTVLGRDTEKHWPRDPYQDLPPDARATAYITDFNHFMARRAQWLQEFQAAGRDATTLPRIGQAATYLPPQPTLAAALQHADLVVEGTVTDVVYSPSGTVGTVRITAIHKASARAAAHVGTARPTEIRVNLGYTPEPDEGFGTGHLVVAENQPLLFRGTHAQLFLQVSEGRSTPTFTPQSFTGGYTSDAGGRVAPLHDNPFADQVRGLTPEQFTALIVRELGNQAP